MLTLCGDKCEGVGLIPPEEPDCADLELGDCVVLRYNATNELANNIKSYVEYSGMCYTDAKETNPEWCDDWLVNGQEALSLTLNYLAGGCGDACSVVGIVPFE